MDDEHLSVHIRINEKVLDNVLFFYAPAPPDRLTSFSGSALPFPNFKTAFENTINQGAVKLREDSSGVVELVHPNAFYDPFTGSHVLPYVEIRYISEAEGAERVWHVQLPFETVRHRSLNHPVNRTSPLFYKPPRGDATRTQERILRDASHIRTGGDFWNGKPPQ